MIEPARESLLLVTHVLIRAGPEGPEIDDQTAAGIAQWCRHFDAVTYFGIAADPAAGAGATTWVPIARLVPDGRATLVGLPNGYSIGGMARHYRSVRKRLRDAIRSHRHLCYTIGGLIGDWPALAGIESIRQRRRFAAWIDRVEPPILRNKAVGAALTRRVAVAAAIPVMERYTRHILRHSAVALLQGRDTYDHYARWAPDPHCTYDTHTHPADRIAAAELATKQARILAGTPLEIRYVGRAAKMKGPEDWLEVLERLHHRGVRFRARWIGDGPELPAMATRVAGSPLANMVELPGFEGDRDVMLRAMRDADLLLYCHKTPESPRCLIEALVSGCPIVGYGTAYPRGLVAARGGGSFAPQDDIDALVERVVALDRDRAELARLVAAAAASGELYSEDEVYAHRAGLMRQA